MNTLSLLWILLLLGPWAMPAAAAMPAPLAQACAALTKDNLAKVPQLRKLGNPDRFADGDLASLQRVLGRCYPTTHGAWALVIDAVQGDAGRWALVHLGADGHRTSLTQGDELAALARLDPPRLFDYDGDGEDEIFVGVHSVVFGEDTHQTSSLRLWSFHDGAVGPYGPTRNIDILTVEDVDGDGRPDLWTYQPYITDPELRKSVDDNGEPIGDGGEPLEMHGPRLLVHSLPSGDFSKQDAAAAAAARKSCPQAPRTLMSSSGETNVVCARLWGAAATALAAQLKRECQAAKAAKAAKKEGSRCDAAEQAVLLDFIKLPPPLTLR